ncbi:MAG: hypothetical protein D6790_16050, partial [Caldilineae bacterium]
MTTSSGGELDPQTNVCGGAGYYDFNVSGDETYFVEIDPSNFNAGQPLEEYVWTSEDTIGTAGDPTGAPEIPTGATDPKGIYYKKYMPLQQLDFNDADFGFVKVDLRISITPGTATNKVGDPHTFTVTVEQKIGSDAWAPVQNGTKPTITVKDSGNNPVTPTSNTCAAPGTFNGQCTVTINSTVAEVYTAHGQVTATINVPLPFSVTVPVTRTRETGGAKNSAAGGTGDATKTYVDLRIS